MQIIHFTTVHQRNDVRVFFKQCVTIAEAGHDISIFVADGLGDESLQGVKIIDIGNFREDRLKRLTKAKKILKQRLKTSNADLYQFHDPELISVGVWLKNRRKVVVYDSHEDVTKQILYKKWLGPLFLRKLFSSIYDRYEKRNVQKLDGVISVIDEITAKFEHENSITIHNYPILGVIEKNRVQIGARANEIVYLGSLSKVRGVLDYINALDLVDREVKLILIGGFSSPDFEKECRALKGWKKVEYLGFLPMNQAIEKMSNAKIALSVLHPEKNYLTSLPTKGFEYMAAGLPTIISDFEYWRPFFKDAMIMVKPQNPDIIAEKINELLENVNLYNELTQKSIQKSKQFSWENEGSRLLKFYKQTIKK